MVEDREQLTSLSLGLLKNPSIQYIKIEDHFGEAMSFGTPVENNRIISVWKLTHQMGTKLIT